MEQVFGKGDLLYQDYKWTAYPDDDPRITGKPDSTLLNRSEGYEMLWFINRYMQSKHWSQKSTGQRIEKFIKGSNIGHLSHARWKTELDNYFRP